MYKMINNIFYNCLQAAAIKINITNKYNNIDIMKLELQIQIISLQILYLYIRYLKHKFILKFIFISYKFFAWQITINLSNLKYLLILIIAGISFFIIINQTNFRKMQDYIVIINFITIAQFIYIISIAIMDLYLLTSRKKIIC